MSAGYELLQRTVSHGASHIQLPTGAQAVAQRKIYSSCYMWGPAPRLFSDVNTHAKDSLATPRRLSLGVHITSAPPKEWKINQSNKIKSKQSHGKRAVKFIHFLLSTVRTSTHRHTQRKNGSAIACNAHPPSRQNITGNNDCLSYGNKVEMGASSRS